MSRGSKDRMNDNRIRNDKCLHSSISHHEHIHKRMIQLADEQTASTYQEDRGVVVCVEEAELAPLAALNDDDGVQEVQNLGQIENVLNLSHAGLFVVKSITEEGVVVCDEESHCAEDHVRAQHLLHRVVEGSNDENEFLGNLGGNRLLLCCLGLLRAVHSLCESEKNNMS